MGKDEFFGNPEPWSPEPQRDAEKGEITFWRESQANLGPNRSGPAAPALS